jgi:hypothetical protein
MDEYWNNLGLVMSYKPKAPLLAKNARNGAPGYLPMIGFSKVGQCS